MTRVFIGFALGLGVVSTIANATQVELRCQPTVVEPINCDVKPKPIECRVA